MGYIGLMRGYSNHKIAVLLGAGASAFANYPTVDSFFRTAWPKGGLLSEACLELARSISILERTTDHSNWPSYNAEKVFAYLEVLDKAQKIQTAGNWGESVSISNRRDLTKTANELMSELKIEIARVYGWKVSPSTLTSAPHNDLFRLLGYYLPDGEPLHVFTTNYDGLLEDLFSHWNNGNSPLGRAFRICTGFSQDQPGRWSPDLLEEKPNQGDGARLIKLAKLHGSISWKKDTDGSTIDTKWRGGTPHDVLLYFGYKSVPEDEPFFALHRLLKLVLLEYDVLLAIGFRFADPYIYELHDIALCANKGLQVIYCLDRSPELESPLSRLTKDFPERIHMLTDSSGVPIPFGNAAFKESLEGILSRILK